MKKPHLSKISVLVIIALSLVYAPLSHKPAVVHANQSRHKLYEEHSIQEDLRPVSKAGSFILRYDGNQSVCQDATPEEAQEIKQRDPNVELHVLNPESQLQTQAADGLTITLRGTAQLDASPAAKAAFQRAAATWQTVIKSPITVIIDVDFGMKRFGKTYDAGVLGSTDSQDVFSNTIYPTVRNRLIASAASTTETNLYNGLPATSVATDIGSTTKVAAPASVFRSLGLIAANADPSSETDQLGDPPSIGFNSAFMYDFDPSDGIDSNKIAFEGVALHEIGHVLGFSSTVGDKELDSTEGVGVTTWDLFRF